MRNLNEYKRRFNILMESTMGDVRPLLSETTMAPEPVPTGEKLVGKLYFDEGDYQMSKTNIDDAIEEVADVLRPSVSTIETFYGTRYDLPSMFQINVGTSHTGTDERNVIVKRGRENLIRGIIEGALKKLNIRATIIESILDATSTTTYKPSKVNRNFYNTKNIKADPKERYAYITITPITTMGLDPEQISTASRNIQSLDVTKSKQVKNVDDIWNLWGYAYDSGYHTEYYTEPNQAAIYQGVTSLKTYSDVKDINQRLIDSNRGGLAKVINSKITDTAKLSGACKALKAAFKRSGKPESKVDCDPKIKIEF